jgi:hypothetical protein
MGSGESSAAVRRGRNTEAGISVVGLPLWVNRYRHGRCRQVSHVASCLKADVSSKGTQCMLVILSKLRSMIMQDHDNPVLAAPHRTPWNKGKLIGAKPPLRPKHVWSIRTKLQVEGRTRDLAMFNLAVDSKLRGCDVVSLKVENVAPRGMPSIGRRCDRKRLGSPSALN